jgi:hypothetical protein
VQALADYRRGSGIDARLVVVGMVANTFSIADPTDPGVLDVVDFDTGDATAHLRLRPRRDLAGERTRPRRAFQAGAPPREQGWRR